MDNLSTLISYGIFLDMFERELITKVQLQELIKLVKISQNNTNDVDSLLPLSYNLI